MNEEKRITAFDNIFSQKLDRIVKDIKKIRKDPTKKDRVKQLLHEAKELKKIIKRGKKNPVVHTIDMPYVLLNGQLCISDPLVADNINIIECMNYDNSKVIIKFTMSV